jgi:hypothetical protein
MKVQAYQTRSANIPPEIVSTAVLTQALLISSDTPSLVFRTSMSFALIRFVNSLLDPLQKRDKSLPLAVLASSAGLPTVFVELRHWGTHESNIPSADVLKDMGIRALEWLWHNYWNKGNEHTNVASQWQRGATSDAMAVALFQTEETQCFGDLVSEMTKTEFEQSLRAWEPLVKILSKGIETFPLGFLQYLLDTLISLPNCKRPLSFRAKSDHIPPDSRDNLKYPATLIPWTMCMIDLKIGNREEGSASDSSYEDTVRLCIKHPNTL